MKPIFFAQALGGCHYEACVLLSMLPRSLSPLAQQVRVFSVSVFKVVYPLPSVPPSVVVSLSHHEPVRGGWI